jgi:peptidoglycan DL-endopeptidase CwlO
VLVVMCTVIGVLIAVVGGKPRQAASTLALQVPAKTAAPVRAPVLPMLNAAGSKPLSVPVAARTTADATVRVAPLNGLKQADLLIVAPFSLPDKVRDEVARQSGVTSTESIEAARVKIRGEYAAVLGVDPSTFRGYAAQSVAASDALWQGVANGGVAVSYSMGTMDKLPLGGKITISGRTQQQLPVVAFGTVGIAGVDAVVSDTTASSLGMPAANALIVSAQPEDVAALTTKIEALMPRGASVEPLVRWVASSSGGTTSTVGSAVTDAGSGAAEGFLTQTQLNTVLQAALSRRGMPYVWGAAGPTSFDCSGLIQWSFAQAGLTMPRVAADQALTGPSVPVSELQAGDLLFYHTDPTDPGYISHVTLYLGNGWMIQAPETGMDVEVVPVDLGSEFAGAVQVEPEVAAQVADGIS